MVAGARYIGMIPMRRCLAARRTGDHRRAFVIRLIGHQPIADAGLPFGPGALEFFAIAFGVVALQELAIPFDPPGDEILAGLLEDRMTFFAIGLQELLAAPAFELRLQLPAEIDDVLEPIVEAEAAIRRMAVRRIAGDEDAADLIALGDGHAQIPEADVIELCLEREPRDILDEAVEIVIVGRGAGRHRRVKEPAFANIDAAEK